MKHIRVFESETQDGNYGVGWEFVYDGQHYGNYLEFPWESNGIPGIVIENMLKTLNELRKVEREPTAPEGTDVHI